MEDAMTKRTQPLFILLIAIGMAISAGLLLTGRRSAAASQKTKTPSADLAPTPPMGWNSYDS